MLNNENNKVYSIDKKNGKSVKVKMNEFQGKKYLDIREYYTDESNEEKPTKKGISISINDASELLKYISNVIEEDNNECQF